MSEPFSLPDGFLFGSATASLQIEGGDTGNTWYRWAERGHIKDGSHCAVAADHWNRVEEDVSLLRELNQQCYRMGIEWSRIEPEPGVFNHEAIAPYRRELELLRQSSIRPMVTLHHFSQPLWFEDSGGWTRPDAAEIFARYVRFAADALGDLVPDWVTINEPNVYLVMGYVFGVWPPGERSIRAYLRAAKQMIRAHHRAYAELHERAARSSWECNVGAAHHIRVFDPLRGSNPLDWAVTGLYRSEFQWVFVNGMTNGSLSLPLISDRAYRNDLAAAQRAASRLSSAHSRHSAADLVSDFLGVNYYSRDMLSFTLRPSRAFGDVHTKPGRPVNDLGWEIYPEGLLRVLRDVGGRYGLPIYITENGTCDAHDLFRSRFIYDHLLAVRQAADEGVDVRRYYHWSLLDNFEWLEGLSIRFGLIHVDYETQKRTVRSSGRFYAGIAAAGGVTPELLEHYL